MKALSKPLSSPGRAEKFPTPLMLRFLRTNVGSRSRGRSRSSPMFILRCKKNGNAAAINETQQEPSSPKVTCIGQVRVRRSSKNSSGSSKSKKKGRSTTSPRQAQCPCYSCPSCSCSCSFTCCGVPRTRFCHDLTSRFRKPKSFCKPFRKWVSFFRFGYCNKVDTRDDSSRFGSIHRSQNHVTAVSSASDIEDSERNVKDPQLIRETKECFLESFSPPKNALLLTRCRSAPYRSSSLASRFWGSPLRSSETETPNNEPEEPADEGGMGRPVSPNLRNEEAESRKSSTHEGSEELDSSSNGMSKDLNVQHLGEIGRESIHPLLLTRCKSEPARTGERLNPEANFLRQRRSDTTESCLHLPQSNCD